MLKMCFFFFEGEWRRGFFLCWFGGGLKWERRVRRVIGSGEVK